MDLPAIVRSQRRGQRRREGLSQGYVISEAINAIARNIARFKRAYTDGDFMKDNILQFASMMNPSSENMLRLISKMALSKQTTIRRIGDLGANVIEN